MMTSREVIIAKRGYPADIQADDLSLKISSYPISARYLADRLSKKGDSIAELCCGVGVSLIEFSYRFKKVIGIDNDQHVVELAKANIANAGLQNCNILIGDIASEDMLRQIQADIVAYDIPYWSEHGASMTQKNPDMKQIVHAATEHITQDIVVYAPPHITYEDALNITDEFEYQEVWINDVHDRNFIYFGGLAEYFGRTKIKLQN